MDKADVVDFMNCPGFDDPDFILCETCSYVNDCSLLKYGASSYPGV